MKGGGFLGIGFEFLGIAGLFTAAGIYLDGRWNGRGLVLVALIAVGIAAGVWHLIRRVNSLNAETGVGTSGGGPNARGTKKAPLTPEENLKRMDELNQRISDLTESGKRRRKS